VESWDEVPNDVGAAPCPWTGPTCIDDCRNSRDGNYQSCNGCSFYARCRDRSTSYINCPNGTVWNDKLKRCIKPSTLIGNTCYCYEERQTCKTTGRRCITSCKGLKDGDYQSCHGCSIYASCVGGYLLYDYRPCASAWPRPPLQWDDNAKRCLFTSKTCSCIRGNELEEDDLSFSRFLAK
jgi:hypothetical protein